ncbi:hypothetical protein SAMN04515667_0658 [Formosa sp. Hel1_31_208]|uniref:hypothetical protein n=1 Tax=Formosa sp. Hel1_31_208 TaxID=1798225 RepID=UPI00087BAF6D|nr:hypothetical protein [Formosa sp. Hel1_31_208]SDR78587.1 hypothetical protein SAMN04515667_0658 [Formosa sp. Hel1_31_208]
MKNKIDIALEYYHKKGQLILNAVNSSKNLTADQIIEYGQDMAAIEFKITALEVAKEN